MDNRLHTIEEVQGYVGLTILGVVPRMPGRRTAVARAMLKTIYAMLKHQEAFRPIEQGSTGQRLGAMAG